VLLITDPACRVACKLPRTEAFGIVRGSGVAVNGEVNLEVLCAVRPCRVDYLPKDDVILKDDEVLTSGLGGVYPEGLLVGYVTRMATAQSGLYQSADLMPAADMGALKYVFVVKR
jgi:rod shape-determining protein MreC